MPYATLDQIAHLLKLTPRTVNLHAKEDGMPRLSRGQYDMVACVHWYIGYLQKLIKDARRGDETEQQARARLTRTTADIRELELGKARAELIEVAQAKLVWERLVIAFKTKILAIPSKLPQRLIACNDINQIKDLLDREIIEALSELSRTEIDVSDLRRPARAHPVDGKPDKSSSKTEGKRVGRQVQGPEPGVKRRAGSVEDGQS
jgi:phage terminase Nu1 subunit (DNA packaging protein)